MTKKSNPKITSLEAQKLKILNDKLDSYVDEFVKEFEKLRKSNPHMNDVLKQQLLKEPIENLIEKTAIALGIYSNTDYLSELKTTHTVGDGLQGRTTSAYDESFKKLFSELNDNPKINLKSKLYSAVGSIAGHLGLKQIQNKFNDKADDAQLYSSMTSLSNTQKKILHGVKDVIVKHKENADIKFSEAKYIKAESKKAKLDRGLT